MKSLTIVSTLCILFIIISGFTDTPKILISQSNSVQSSNESSSKQPSIFEGKKLKAKQMPNWQRVIPGMFR